MHNKITNTPELIHVKRFKRSQSQLTDENLRDILLTENSFKECEEIDLSYNVIGDMLISKFVNIQQAAIINLSYNNIHDESARCLAKCRNIHTLYLSGNPISDNGMLAFFSNHSIQNLYFHKCNLSNTMQEALWQHLERNRTNAKHSRCLFFQALLVLLYDRCKRSASQSFFSLLPTEIFIKILSSIQFADLGVTPSQGESLLKFIFDNTDQIFKSLANRSGVKIEIDPWHQTAKHRYRFYRSPDKQTEPNKSLHEAIASRVCGVQ